MRQNARQLRLTKLSAFMAVALIATASTNSAAHAQAEKKPANQAQQTPFDDHARQAGIKACKDVFPTLGAVMAADSAYRTATFWNQKEADKHATASLAGLGFSHPDLKGAGAGVIYAAPVGKGCEGLSVRIVPVPGTCPAFIATLQDDVAQREDLIGVELLILKSGVRVMALPASDSTCLAVTTVFANGKLE